MLESYGEILAPHYTKGGLPGYYPPIKGKRPELIFNLYDPFNWFDAAYPGKDKARGRQVEINNGRLAMLGIFSLLSESAAPGAVPPLTLVNYIVDASGLTELNFPSIDLPVIGTVGGRVELNHSGTCFAGHGDGALSDFRTGRRLGVPQLVPAVHAAGRPLHRHGRLAVLDAGQRAARRRRQLGACFGKGDRAGWGRVIVDPSLPSLTAGARRRRDT